ncbi:hypothetical protein QAD02_021915 [Eretmocerus hayati]|uniref:Uncharacterized protein n=1 Tax=Eretmocerus hayati TaxID=131215 RepID=A0ACC2PRI4_9HYME|nr:hypothetical protein QAD02_021915 [Eretmocerus hayati]
MYEVQSETKKKNPGERSTHEVAGELQLLINRGKPDFAQNLSTGSTPTSSQEINPSQQSSSSAGYLPGGRDYENQSVRGSVNIMNADVVSALYIGGVTYRNTMRIFSAVGKVLRVPIKNIILNKTSFCRMRKKIREEHSGQIMTCFGRSDLNAAILHVDGKRMLDKTTHKFVERLPVVLSDGKTTKIISIPKLDDARGKTQAHAVYNELFRWGLVESIKGICLDTTASNLGRHSGLAVLLEQLLESELLYLPCRHHIYEIILGCAFKLKIPKTVGPEVQLFKRFQSSWDNIDKDRLKIPEEDDFHPSLIFLLEDLKEFYSNFEKKCLPRDDYEY